MKLSQSHREQDIADNNKISMLPHTALKFALNVRPSPTKRYLNISRATSSQQISGKISESKQIYYKEFLKNLW